MLMTISGTCMTIVRGDTEAVRVSLLDADGIPVDFEVGDVVTLSIGLINPTTSDITIKCFFSETVAVATNTVELTILGVETALLIPTSEYKYDIQWTKVGGAKRTIIPYSDFNVIPEVTV